MRLKSENAVRKVDTLGRVSIPKGLRDRLGIDTGDSVEFYVLEDGGKSYICFNKAGGQESANPEYEIAAKVLRELGYEVPKQLLEE